MNESLHTEQQPFERQQQSRLRELFQDGRNQLQTVRAGDVFGAVVDVAIGGVIIYGALEAVRSKDDVGRFVSGVAKVALGFGFGNMARR